MPTFAIPEAAKAALGLLRAHWQLVAIAALLLALLLTRSTLAQIREERDAARAQAAELVDATRAAAANPRLSARDAPAQIRALGASIGALEQGLARCNATARDAAENDARRQAEADRRLTQAQDQADEARSIADRLRQSAGRAAGSTENCEPSDTLKEIWR